MAQEINVYDSTGKKTSPLSLTVDLVKKDINDVAFSTAIRVLLQNWRQGTVSSKSRGEIAFSNRKPWRQKGTGRARAGSPRSPLWRKGGIIFGPQKRVRTLTLNKGQKKIAFNNIFFGFNENERIACLDVNFDNVPSTKKANGFLKGLDLCHKKVLVFLSREDEVAYASFRNLPNVNIVYFDHPNAFDLSNADYWLFLKKDSELFNEMVEKWN